VLLLQRVESDKLCGIAEVSSAPPSAAAPSAMTLHQAVELILRENSNQPMTVR
jgi:hypothetical protein